MKLVRIIWKRNMKIIHKDDNMVIEEEQEGMEGIVYWKSPSSKTHKHTASLYFLQATKFRAVNKRKGNLHIYAVDV